MKIGIVAMGFIPGGTGGTESYFRNLVSGLQKYDKINKYTLVVRKEYLDEAKCIVHSKNWRVVGLKINAPIHTRALIKIRILKSSHESLMTDAIDKFGFDLIHFPMQTIYPYGVKAKKVLTFHDMQEKYYPGFFSKEELEFRKNNYERSANEADKIITISDNTKNDIKKYYSLAAYDKCVTVYTGNDIIYKPEHIRALSEGAHEYFFYPAATWPHKNHERLIKAFAKVHNKHPNYKLVLTGLKRQRSEAINALLEELGIKNAVTIKGYLSYKELKYVFRKAYALVFPSLFEGFGLPVLEAMASGVPVLCSNTTSLPEVGGKAAIYFDPLKINDITRAMEKIISSKKLRQRMIIKGYSQANKFTIKKMIVGTMNVYIEACHEK